jgi:apolipoprotein N-acyltransferase
MVDSCRMKKNALMPWLLAALSALMLLLPFSIAGPVPWWRTLFAWVALVPLLIALLKRKAIEPKRYLFRSALLAYITGVLWYLGNCYWIYQTMFFYGGIPALGSAGILLAYSLILGLYFACFGFLVSLIAKSSRSILPPLIAAPFLWVALEFAASRITSVPWDQLGYSQVDNYLLSGLATFTGVYGLSFILVSASSIVSAFISHAESLRYRFAVLCAGAGLIVVLGSGHFFPPPPQPTQANAVLMQPNLSVKGDSAWDADVYDANVADFSRLSKQTCGTYIAGLPETNAPREVTPCTNSPAKTDLIAWPEAPTAFHDIDPHFQEVMGRLATETGASVIVGNVGVETKPGGFTIFNSAAVFSPQGNYVGRYDKIHLVPFGEYVPFKDLLFFAGHLTRNVSDFGRGEYRKVFRSGGHRYGVFICYESIFADEIRQFAVNGAEVFVNISDDGWYGNTSAPWQHLNMARMRAIENRRWILRDTNNGTTTIIDPYGRPTVSIPRNIRGSLAGRYGFRDDVTFYSAHGDVFALLCAIIAIALSAWAAKTVVLAPKDSLDR